MFGSRSLLDTLNIELWKEKTDNVVVELSDENIQ